MRRKLTRELLETFMREMGRRARGPGHVYFTGGATALLLGLREQTIDIDLRLDPEPAGAFEAIAALKESLCINIELASPADFVPVTADWPARSPFIGKTGGVCFSHFDLRAQALSKIERGFVQDLEDARSFLRTGEVSPAAFQEYFRAVQPGLLRYPAIDPERLAAKVRAFAALP